MTGAAKEHSAHYGLPLYEVQPTRWASALRSKTAYSVAEHAEPSCSVKAKQSLGRRHRPCELVRLSTAAYRLSSVSGGHEGVN